MVEDYIGRPKDKVEWTNEIILWY